MILLRNQLWDSSDSDTLFPFSLSGNRGWTRMNTDDVNVVDVAAEALVNSAFFNPSSNNHCPRITKQLALAAEQEAAKTD